MVALGLEDNMGQEQDVSKKKDLSGYAALIVAVSGLITVFVHKPTEDAAKTGYIELTTAILAVQEAEKQNHDDIAKLHAYVESYTHEHKVTLTAATTSASMPFAPTPLTDVVVQSAATASPPPLAPPTALKRIKSVNDISW